MGCCVSGFSSTCFTYCSASVCCCEDNRVHPLVGSSKGRGSLSSPVHDGIALPGQSAGGHEIAKPLKMPLTEREVIVMMRSWKNVQNKIVETGMATFLRMFESSPEVKLVFEKFRTVDTGVALWQSNVLETHGLVVMSAMDEIISNLDDEESVYELIQEQGRSHARFGEDLTDEIFWAIEKPFLLSVKEILGDHFSPIMEDLYARTTHFILYMLVMAFNEVTAIPNGDQGR